MRKISFNLFDSRDIGRAILDLERYRRETQDRVDRLITALVDEGKEYVHEAILNNYQLVPWETGALFDSIEGAYNMNTGVGIIYTNRPYAIYVQMGTGPRGANGPSAPDPYPAVYRQDGWWYYHNGDWHYTLGMESRPFMWDAAQRLRQECTTIAKEVFGK